MARSTDLDIVIPVRQGNLNEELRYTLRALTKHLPHRGVYIMGYLPGWLQNVGHQGYEQGVNVYRNTTEGMSRACNTPDISDPFLWFNDDYFLMKPLESMPRLNRGPIEGVITGYGNKKDGYVHSMIATKTLLLKNGYTDILSYELHMPMLVWKEPMKQAIDMFHEHKLIALHKRTLYGNICAYGGTEVKDHKVTHQLTEFDRDCTWVSTSDTSFAKYAIGAWIRQHFEEKSCYEV